VSSGLLRDSTHVRQARSPCLRCCPGVTVVILGRLPHQAREGHGLLIGDMSEPVHPDADFPGRDAVVPALGADGFTDRCS